MKLAIVVLKSHTSELFQFVQSFVSYCSKHDITLVASSDGVFQSGHLCYA